MSSHGEFRPYPQESRDVHCMTTFGPSFQEIPGKVPRPRTHAPQHHKGSSPKADEAQPTHQTRPQCAIVTGRYRKVLTHGKPHRGSS